MIGIGISPFLLKEEGFVLPSPPFVIATTNSGLFSNANSLEYEEGMGPSSHTVNFRIWTSDLSPSSGNVTVTPDPSGNFEVFNGASYTTSPFTVPYNGDLYTGLIYNIRLKAGLSSGNYSGVITLSAGNAPDFEINVTASVEMGQYIVATGGTITRDGDYLVHEMTSTDVFEVTQVGSIFNTVEYRFFGGGGGCGLDGGYGGGGGAGGERTGTTVVTVGSYPVVIGAGGPNTGPNRNGNNSTFNGITATGGGGGGMSSNGENGGSGGGASRLGNIGGSGVVGQGNNGGDAADGPAPCGAGGGGGAGAVGQKGQPGEEGGDGGAGSSSTITGVSQTLGGGGGGGGTPGGTGGAGGGGDGGASGAGSTDGAINTGSGGGGNTGSTSAGMGGSGIWQARYYHPL